MAGIRFRDPPWKTPARAQLTRIGTPENHHFSHCRLQPPAGRMQRQSSSILVSARSMKTGEWVRVPLKRGLVRRRPGTRPRVALKPTLSASFRTCWRYSADRSG